MDWQEFTMILEISEEERNLLLELIEGAEETAIQSMDHADSRSFKGVLKTKLELLASAKEKISGQGLQAP
jgi:hypothetical protein